MVGYPTYCLAGASSSQMNWAPDPEASKLAAPPSYPHPPHCPPSWPSPGRPFQTATSSTPSGLLIQAPDTSVLWTGTSHLCYVMLPSCPGWYRTSDGRELSDPRNTSRPVWTRSLEVCCQSPRPLKGVAGAPAWSQTQVVPATPSLAHQGRWLDVSGAIALLSWQ